MFPEDKMPSLFSEDEMRSLFQEDKMPSLFSEDKMRSLFSEDKIRSLFEDTTRSLFPGGITSSFNNGSGIQDFRNSTIIGSVKVINSHYERLEVYDLIEEVRQRVSEAPLDREAFNYIMFVVRHITSKKYFDVIPRETMQNLQNLRNRFEVYNMLVEVGQRFSEALFDPETFNYLVFLVRYISSTKYYDIISSETMKNLQNLQKRFEVYNMLVEVRQRYSEALFDPETFNYLVFVVRYISSTKYCDIISSETMQNLQNLQKRFEVYNMLVEVRQQFSEAPHDRETFNYIVFVVRHIASKNYFDVIPKERMQRVLKQLQNLQKQLEVNNLEKEVRQRFSEALLDRETFIYLVFVIRHIASENYSDVIPSERMEILMEYLQHIRKQLEVYNLEEEVLQRLSEAPLDPETFNYLVIVVRHISSEKYSGITSSETIKELQDQQKLLQQYHHLHSRTTIAMGIIGPGSVGSTLLDQIRDRAAILKEERNIDLRVMGIMGSKLMLLDDDDNKGINLDKWRTLGEEKGEVANLEKFVTNLEKFVQNVRGNDFIPNTVLVDCTADSVIARNYHDWLSKGIYVITANKKANSGPLKEYLKLRALQRQSYTRYFYEATVGAGLPIISTLRGLLETGDRILQIEGIFSGTLSYIFNNFKDGRLFSEVVAEARDAGYTEPDPRDDLSGTDVARKVIILARESGLELGLSDITVKNLVPELIRVSASAQEFMQQLPKFDQELAEKLKHAESAEEVLRYVGVVDVRNNKGVVELRRYKKDHPFAQVSGSDNMIAFTTRIYKTQPLIIRGPGAGAQFAAGGIFRDILRLASYLGAPS